MCECTWWLYIWKDRNICLRMNMNIRRYSTICSEDPLKSKINMNTETEIIELQNYWKETFKHFIHDVFTIKQALVHNSLWFFFFLLLFNIMNY